MSEPAAQGTRLHIVSGKGGTGKTTVAAALALAVASGGRNVLLCEVEGRQGIAQLFDVSPLPYEERKVAVAPDGGDVYALAIDAEEALLEYLQMYYKLGRAGRALDRFGVIDFATTIAPGLRDVLLTGKVYEAVTRSAAKRGRRYDAVVLDAPPTGRLTRFLNVNREVAGLARVGPVRSQADSIMAMMRSPRTAVHLVTLLEDMPVQETVDSIAELSKADLPLGAVVVNQVRRTPLDAAALSSAADGGLPAQDLGAALRRARLPDSEPVVAGLFTEARELAERLALEEEQRSIVDGLALPSVELPLLADGVDLGGLYELAEEIVEQLLEREPG